MKLREEKAEQKCEEISFAFVKQSLLKVFCSSHRCGEQSHEKKISDPVRKSDEKKSQNTVIQT